MTVTGTNIPAGTYVGTVTNSGTTVNLVQADGSTPVTPPATTGPYTFTQPGSIAPNSNTITNVDPTVGMYLRPGMLVTGSGIQTPTNSIPPTYIQSISSDFTQITLTQNGTALG